MAALCSSRDTQVMQVIANAYEQGHRSADSILNTVSPDTRQNLILMFGQNARAAITEFINIENNRRRMVGSGSMRSNNSYNTSLHTSPTYMSGLNETSNYGTNYGGTTPNYNMGTHWDTRNTHTGFWPWQWYRSQQ